MPRTVRSSKLPASRQTALTALIDTLSKSEIEFLQQKLALRLQELQDISNLHINSFANEILIQIFVYLSNPETLAICSKVCRKWKILLNDNILWKNYCHKKAYKALSKRNAGIIQNQGGKHSIIYKHISLVAWKDIYMENYLTWKNWTLGKCKVSRVTKNSHAGFICMDFNEKHAISIKVGQPTKLWNLETGECNMRLDTETQLFTAVKFNDMYIVGGFNSGDIKVWLVGQKTVRSVLRGHTEEVGAISIYNDTAASGSEDQSIRIWNLITGECEKIMQGHTGPISAIQLGKNRAVSGSTDSTIKIWDVQSGACQRTLSGHNGTVFTLQFDDRYVCSGGDDSSIIVWDFNTGKLLRRLTGHHHAVICLQFDHAKIVTGSADKTIKTAAGHRNRSKTIGESSIKRSSPVASANSVRSSVAPPIELDNHISDDTVFSQFIKQFPRCSWKLRRKWLLSILYECDPTDMDYLNDRIPRLHRDFIKLLSSKIVYRILEFVNPKDLAILSQVSRTWNSILTSKDLWFALYESIGLKSMAPVFYIDGGNARDNARRFYSYGNWANGKFSSRKFVAHELGILCMYFDSKCIATGSSDKTCKMFNIKNGVCLRTFSGHTESILSVQFDDDKIITGSADHTLRLWQNKDNGSVICTFVDHTAAVTCLKYINDKLISGSEDKTIRIWEIGDYLKKSKYPNGDGMRQPNICSASRTLHGHDSAIKCLDFQADARDLISIGLEDTITGLFNPHPQILHDPISGVQYCEDRLLVSTLSGYAFLFSVTPLPMPDTVLYKSYEKLLKWAQTKSTFTENGVYRYQSKYNKQKHGGMHGKWSLCAKSDAWRLMNGGSQGFVGVWNHRTRRFLYKLKTVDEPEYEEKPAKKLTKEVTGSLASFAKKEKKDSARALTGLAFDDSYIIASSMDGVIYVWQPHILT
ncbi:hypothetical protein HDV01_005767 [Terramyces sp. JEL0728]|nr:hypothetical protein HDV01_005767 [Terramyces sp. JEL0728]